MLLQFILQARKQIPDKINEAEEKARRVLSALNLQETQLIEKIEENKKKKIELSAEYDRTKEELHLSRDDFEKEVAKNTKVFYKLRAAYARKKLCKCNFVMQNMQQSYTCHSRQA